MNIFVFGTRGFPYIQGGVASHCENLYSIIADEQYRITVFRRKPFLSLVTINNRNISFIDLPSTKLKGFEAFFHSFLCTIVCLIRRPDIVHIHNIGPGIFAPFLKIAGIKVVLTYHSPNYEHKKWSFLAKKFLKFSELISIKFSDKVIFVSKFQKDKFGYNKKFIQINNGVRFPSATNNDDYINTLGLIKKNYILSLGRFVEEKGFDYLIRAFCKIKQQNYRLVIVGDCDHETKYSKQLKELAKANDVVLTGFLKGEKLMELFSHARLFVLPSYHEGLPICLLEAMSFHLPVLVSDIPANKQIALPENRYFITGNEESLIQGLKQQLNCIFEPVNYDLTPYNWDHIAMQTKTVYEQVMK